MSIIGWIKLGDKAACGATVVEAFDGFKIHEIPVTYQGAKMSCGCVIVEAESTFTLPNGHNVPKHGHKTSGKCPLLSSENASAGRETFNQQEPAQAYAPRQAGWEGIKPPVQEHSKPFDEYFVIVDSATGTIAENRAYRITLENGETIEGFTDEEGRTTYATSDGRKAVSIEIAYPTQMQAD